MKALLLIALTIAMAAAVVAQQPCTMTKDQLPAMRKLRLGMERAEFEKQYRGASILVMKRHAVDPSDFEGLEGIAFDFHQGRLYFIEFNFDPKTANWGKVQDFAKNVSENLKVPESSWRFEPGDFLATMRCADFWVKLNTRFRSLTLRDTVAEKAKKAEEASKKNVKALTLSQNPLSGLRFFDIGTIRKPPIRGYITPPPDRPKAHRRGRPVLGLQYCDILSSLRNRRNADQTPLS